MIETFTAFEGLRRLASGPLTEIAPTIKRAEQRVKDTLAQGGTPRSDDEPDTVKHRQKVYRENTAPLLDFYGKQGKVVTVDGMAPIESVTQAIAAALEGAL